MSVKIKLFARASDLAGSSEIQVELPDSSTVAQLREAIVQQYPQLAALAPKLFIAINNEFAADADQIPADAEVASFPPVSGG